MATGGAAAKFASEYEAQWTSSQLLRLLDFSLLELTPEPVEGGIGVEFCAKRANAISERHSVKNETSLQHWTLATLTNEAKTGRSFLGDLIAFTRIDRDAEATFVSQVMANDMRRLCNEARRASTFHVFEGFWQSMDGRLRGEVEKHVLPIFQSLEEMYGNMRRIQVVCKGQTELLNERDREIARSLYRLDHAKLNVGDTGRLLEAIVVENLRIPITRDSLLARLEQEQIGQSDWSRDPHIRLLVQKRNETYVATIHRQLINGTEIPRVEAAQALTKILNGPERFGLFVGASGMGKSCTVAQLVNKLRSASIPHLVIRLDIQTDKVTSRGFGEILDLPASPVDVIAGIAGENPSVLLIDQLDALSAVSGRNRNLWGVVDELLKDLEARPHVKVWLVCRGFDLENDARLRSMVQDKKPFRIDLQLLPRETVDVQILAAGATPAGLGPKQLEMLQTPGHLAIYIEGKPAGKPPFATVQELYGRYWSVKREAVSKALGRDARWKDMIRFICEDLSSRQTLSMPADRLEDSFPDDVREMAGANVLIKENRTYRFFHEGFFDYAFARIFVSDGHTLEELLLKGGEQHLFRRSQVRQVLSYLRSQDPDLQEYLKQLRFILQHPEVRSHIKGLVLEWMKRLPDPQPAEIEILELHEI
jgi:hypothetical protein